jgi:hypothetical protein
MRVNKYDLDTKIIKNKRFAMFLWILVMTFDMMKPCQLAAAEKKLYNAMGKRDPFVQLVGLAGGSRQAAGALAGVENLEEIRVEGIMMDANPKQSVVVANGSVLKEGDEAGNVKLLRIEETGATFSVNGLEGFRPLYQEETKK